MPQIITRKNINNIVQHLKASKHYLEFKSILQHKIDNENKAKLILKSNLGNIKYKHLKDIFGLIDENYMQVFGYGGIGSPWFGRLLHANKKLIFNETESDINKWFDLLTDNKYSIPERINMSLKYPYHIKGAGVGLATLVFYLLDKSNYLIWFRVLHEGLKIVYPNLINFDKKGMSYDRFNDIGKIFAKTYNFEHTEMDWVLWKIGIAYRLAP